MKMALLALHHGLLYNHFKRHYQDYGKEVPELKSDSELDEIMMTKGIIDAPLTKEDINE